MPYSPITQELLNYFDETDARVREVPFTLDAQLLNTAAQTLEKENLKIDREVAGRYLSRVPQLPDNRGVYHKLQLPPTFPLLNDGTTLLPPKKVVGKPATSNTSIELKPYDDTLPVPSRIDVDGTRSTQVVSNPVLATFNGNDGTQVSYGANLSIPNKLTLCLDGLNDYAGTVTVLIEGDHYPKSLWLKTQDSQTETLVLDREGVFQSRTVWQSIDRISVYSLPNQASLVAYSLPASLPRIEDPREFHHSQYRDNPLPRSWKADGFYLKEQYYTGRKSGYETYRMLPLPAASTSIALEPNTNGMWVASGMTLAYLDRRQPLPDRLDVTALTEEPCFGIKATLDLTIPDRRHVYLDVQPYALAYQVGQYRWIAEMPDRTTYLLAPNGTLTMYSEYMGWTSGIPKPISFPVTELGTYVFKLQTDSSIGFREDRAVYLNEGFSPLAQFDLSSLVSAVKGIFFDSSEQLWIWTGKVVVPIRIYYDAFLFEPAERALYLTDPYESVDVWRPEEDA